MAAEAKRKLKGRSQLLSSCLEGGRAFVFFASGKQEFSAISPCVGQSTADGLQPLDSWSWSFGPTVTAKQEPGLKTNGEAWLEPILPALVARMSKRLEAGTWIVQPADEDLPTPFLFNAGEHTSWTLRLPATDREIEIGLAPAGELDFSYMHWSVSFKVEGAELTPVERSQAAQFFFVTVARFMLGVGPERPAPEPDQGLEPEPGSEPLPEFTELPE